MCPAVDRRFIPIVAAKWTRTAKYCKSVSEEPTTVVRRLEEMSAKDKLLFHTNNVYDCVTKSKFDYGYGCRHLLNDGTMRTIVVMFGGMLALVCGNGDVGKGLRFRSPWFLSSRVLAGCNPLTGRPGSQRNPAPAREVVDNARHECGHVGSVGQAARREFP